MHKQFELNKLNRQALLSVIKLSIAEIAPLYQARQQFTHADAWNNAMLYNFAYKYKWEPEKIMPAYLNQINELENQAIRTQKSELLKKHHDLTAQLSKLKNDQQLWQSPDIINHNSSYYQSIYSNMKNEYADYVGYAIAGLSVLGMVIVPIITFFVYSATHVSGGNARNDLLSWLGTAFITPPIVGLCYIPIHFLIKPFLLHSRTRKTIKKQQSTFIQSNNIAKIQVKVDAIEQQLKSLADVEPLSSSYDSNHYQKQANEYKQYRDQLQKLYQHVVNVDNDFYAVNDHVCYQIPPQFRNINSLLRIHAILDAQRATRWSQAANIVEHEKYNEQALLALYHINNTISDGVSSIANTIQNEGIALKSTILSEMANNQTNHENIQTAINYQSHQLSNLQTTISTYALLEYLNK